MTTLSHALSCAPRAVRERGRIIIAICPAANP